MIFNKFKFFLYILLTMFLMKHLQSFGATAVKEPKDQGYIYKIRNGEVPIEGSSEIKTDDFFPFIKRDINAQYKPVQIDIAPATYDELRSMNLSRCTGAVCPMMLLYTKLERHVIQTDTIEKTMSLLRWTPSTSGGLVASLNFKMNKAQGITLEVLVKKIPDSALVRYSSHEDSRVAQLTGAQIKQLIATEIENTGSGMYRRIYSSRDSRGADNITLEFELPPKLSPTDLEIAVPKVISQHF